MPDLLHHLPIGFEWLRAVILAIAILLTGFALFRLLVRRMALLLYRAEPGHAHEVLRRLVPPYLVTVAAGTANAFRGMFGAQADWWLGVLLAPSLVVLVVETVRLGIVDFVLQRHGGRAVPKILRDIAFGLVYAIAALVYLGTVFKIDITPFLTTSAILSVVIGMALQDTLGNLFAGLAINLDRPFGLGDWVAIDTTVGRVVEITWRATKIMTSRQEMHILPNNAVSKARVVNYQLPSSCYAESVELGCAYDVPPNRIRGIALEVAREVPGILAQPVPEVHLLRYADSAIVYRVNLWIDDYGRSVPLRSQFQERLWYHFRREGLEWPYPTRTVQLEDAGARAQGQVQENLRALRRIDVLACMGEESVSTLAKKAQIRHYAAGERILRQGDAGGSLFIIKQGHVTLSLDEQGGHDTKPFGSLGEGQFFGEMSLLTGERRTASVHAATDCEFLVIERRHLAPLLEEHPEFMRQISQTIAERRQNMETVKVALAEAREHTVPAQDQTRAEVEATSNEIFNRIRSFFTLT